MSPLIAKLHDLASALTTLPTARAWRRCAAIYVLFLAAALPIGLSTGLLQPLVVAWPPSIIGRLGILLFLHPAFTEELVFRGLLLPRGVAGRTRSDLALRVTVALVVYVAAHPLNAALFRPERLDLFANPAYLALTALLGLACSASYIVAGSLWPPVLIHGSTVIVWIALLGGAAALGIGPG